MKIIYPSLVEDAFNIVDKAGTIIPSKVNDVKAHIYRMMVQNGVLNEDGSPTQKAIERRLIERIDSLDDYKRIYPEFKEFSDNHFKKTNLGWCVDGYVLCTLAKRIVDDPTSSEEQRRRAYAMLDELEGDSFNS